MQVFSTSIGQLIANRTGAKAKFYKLLTPEQRAKADQLHRQFRQQMEQCFAALLGAAEPDRHIEPDEALLPVITLTPPPESWPDLAEYLAEGDKG